MPKVKATPLLITISGTPGAGKGTVSALLAEKLRLKAYSIGDVFRSMAHDKGMTLLEFERHVSANPAIDRELDRWQGKMVDSLGQGIFEGQVSFLFIPKSIKILLRCSIAEAARRIRLDPHEKRHQEADLTTQTKAMAAIRQRMAMREHRYRTFYHVDVFSPAHYDLIVNTTHKTPAQVVRVITDFLAKQDNVNKPGTRKLTVKNRTTVIHKILKRKKTLR